MVTPEERMISQYSTNKRSEYDFFDHDSVDVDKHIRLMRELKESKIKIGKRFYHWKFLLVIRDFTSIIQFYSSKTVCSSYFPDN